MKKTFTIAAAALVLLLAGVGIWNASNFAETRLEQEMHDSRTEAFFAAIEYRNAHGSPEDRIIRTRGASNSWSDEDERGYIIVCMIPFHELEANQFAVRRDSEQSVMHRIRYREGNAWVMEGDNNERPDPNLLTPENYAGVVLDSTVFRWDGE